VTAGHSLFDVETEKDIECREHRDEAVRFYCEPCDMCICILCTFNEHRDHDIAQFSDAVGKYKDSIRALLADCQVWQTIRLGHRTPVGLPPKLDDRTAEPENEGLLLVEGEACISARDRGLGVLYKLPDGVQTFPRPPNGFAYFLYRYSQDGRS